MIGALPEKSTQIPQGSVGVFVPTESRFPGMY
jgi:hypothetical protein